MQKSIQELSEEIKQSRPPIETLFEQISKVIVGQRYLVSRMALGLFLEGHLLIEGVPGLAKTTAVKALSDLVHLAFKRIQFTPDLLPADLIGTQIYDPKNQQFGVKKGPIFANLILADEINRAPAKVQSALLEAMQERQVTIGEETFMLPRPFLVLATQNPIEQEGTYPLPEAQTDRFMLKLTIDYPTFDEELAIMERAGTSVSEPLEPVLGAADLALFRNLISQVYVDPKVRDYILRIVFATRRPAELNIGLENYIQFGASPRASIFLYRVAQGYAFLEGRAYVTPQDVKTIAPDVLRHRLLPTYEAEAENLNTDRILEKILERLEVP